MNTVSMVVNCPTCFVECDEDTSRCPRCGTPIDVTQCPYCEAVNQRAAPQCHHCGLPLSNDAQSETDAETDAPSMPSPMPMVWAAADANRVRSHRLALVLVAIVAVAAAAFVLGRDGSPPADARSALVTQSPAPVNLTGLRWLPHLSDGLAVMDDTALATPWTEVERAPAHRARRNVASRISLAPPVTIPAMADVPVIAESRMTSSALALAALPAEQPVSAAAVAPPTAGFVCTNPLVLLGQCRPEQFATGN
jgi:hypothetical protein